MSGTGERTLALALGVIWAGAPAAACRLALVLGMDVSASVDSREYALMMRGTAAAMRAPEVAAAFLTGAPVALSAFVWAGAREQAMVLDWTLIVDEAALAAAAGRIAGFARPGGDPLGPWSGRTGVGGAMLAARGLLDRAPDCDAQTLDLAGDGVSNDGPEPGPLRGALFQGVTVNALAVSGDLPVDHGTLAEEGGRLSGWFAAEVLHGPGAFVESADAYSDFERAMTRKLLRELRPALLGDRGPGRDAPIAAARESR
ncbi:DUF1194 domain-containing protein [Pararhodobacter sp. SW119]|uniref:DUF1194 domain-containing protein n=1 Tax=Pararhodobacter sp. SW119 TaxID=2780075 RepID=UPI001ADF7930|nr:DUF1194 domain-containing protein [Pararhodobacter sp. SW119]